MNLSNDVNLARRAVARYLRVTFMAFTKAAVLTMHFVHVYNRKE